MQTMMPTYLGKPLYPMGFPLCMDDISVNGETIQEIFLRKCENKATINDENVLKSYLIYYINAPIFHSEFTKELKQKDLMAISLDDSIMECLEYGLDPF